MAGVQLLGRRSLPAPPVAHPSRLPAWWTAQGPVGAGFGLLRLLVLLAGAYLLGIGAMALLLTRSGCRRGGAHRRLARLVRAVPGVRPLARALFGVSVATGVGLAGSGAALAQEAGSADRAPPVMQLIDPSGGAESWRAPPMVALEHAASPVPVRPAATVVRPPRRPPAPAAPEWVIRPGDHLWAVAAGTLRAAWGVQPDEATLARYWWRLLELNRPYLPDRSNPDLVFPGDRILLPPVPPRQE
jgi:hypothetical protein